MSITRLTRLGAVGMVAAVVATGSTNATATLATSTTGIPAVRVVKACAKKSTGELRLVTSRKKCRANERFVKWNVKGPTGPNGPTGSTGPAGSAGPAGSTGPTGPTGPSGAPGSNGAPGPSHTYSANSGAPIIELTSAATDVVQVTVPAGKYLVQANTYLFQPTGVNPLIGICRVLANGQPIDENLVGAALFDAAAPGTTASVPIALTFTATATTTVAYSCSAVVPGNTLRAQLASMTLTEVGAIN